MGIDICTYRTRIGTFQFRIRTNKKTKLRMPKTFNLNRSFYMNIIILVLTVTMTKSTLLIDVQPPQHSLPPPTLSHHKPGAAVTVSSDCRTPDQVKLSTTTFSHGRCKLSSSGPALISAKVKWGKGLKFIGGTNINKVMHAQNGNKRNLGYKIAAWNCNRGLLKSGDQDSDKLTEIKLFIEENKPHLLGIIESDLHGPNSRANRRTTFTTDEIQEKLKIDGYSIYFPNTWEAHHQARLVVYINNEIKVKVKDLAVENNDLPTITFEIGLGREKKSLVNFYYREWTSGVSGEKSEQSQVDRFERQVQVWRNLSAESRDIVLLGDANFCFFDCNDQDYPKHLKEISTIAMDFYLEEAFSQLVDINTLEQS